VGREVRAVLAGFGALGVWRGEGCAVYGVCEGQRKKGCIVLEIGRKRLSAAVLAVLNLNLAVNLQMALALALAPVLVLVLVLLERFRRRRCSGVRGN
jgi:hypothetical protein